MGQGLGPASRGQQFSIDEAFQFGRLLGGPIGGSVEDPLTQRGQLIEPPPFFRVEETIGSQNVCEKGDPWPETCGLRPS